ncbi:MAG: hypothetical protein ACJA2F_001282, partial [Nitriliruptoraceae bacterium]
GVLGRATHAVLRGFEGEDAPRVLASTHSHPGKRPTAFARQRRPGSCAEVVCGGRVRGSCAQAASLRAASVYGCASPPWGRWQQLATAAPLSPAGLSRTGLATRDLPYRPAKPSTGLVRTRTRISARTPAASPHVACSPYRAACRARVEHTPTLVAGPCQLCARRPCAILHVLGLHAAHRPRTVGDRAACAGLLAASRRSRVTCATASRGEPHWIC